MSDMNNGFVLKNRQYVCRFSSFQPSLATLVSYRFLVFLYFRNLYANLDTRTFLLRVLSVQAHQCHVFK